MIEISEIKWLSKDGREAEVKIKDENFVLNCFCHPCNYEANQEISGELYSFNVSNILRLDPLHQKFEFKKIDGYFSYLLSGRVQDLVERRVQIGKFIIELEDQLPGDIEQGDYVSFRCERLDLY